MAAPGDKREEVRKLAEKLDKEIDDFIEEKIKKNAGYKYEDDFSDDVCCIVASSCHNFVFGIMNV